MKRILIFCFLFVSVFIYSETDEFFIEIENLIDNFKYEEAIKLLTSKGLEISVYPKVGYYLGVCYFKLKKYELAENFLEKAYNSGYRNEYLYYNLGVVKFKLKKYKEALFYLKKSKNNMFLADKSLYLIVTSYLKLGERDEAVEAYKELRNNFPYSINLLKTQDVLEKFNIDYKKYEYKNLSFYISPNLGYETNLNFASEKYYDIVGLKDYFYSTNISILFSEEPISFSLGLTLKNYLNYTNYNFKNFFTSVSFNLLRSPEMSFIMFGNYYVGDEPIQKDFGVKLKNIFNIEDLIFEISAGYIFEDFLNISYKELNGGTQEYCLSTKLGIFRLETMFRSKNAESNIYSYDMLSYGGRLEERFGKILVSLGALISNKSYTNREDKIATLYTTTILELTQNSNLNFTYNNSKSDSSDEMYTYKTQNFSLNLDLYF